MFYSCVTSDIIITIFIVFRRTGAVIEINARKDSHGFDLVEDYFPDSSMCISRESYLMYLLTINPLIICYIRNNLLHIQSFFTNLVAESEISVASNKGEL
jgi:hypothetical protein